MSQAKLKKPSKPNSHSILVGKNFMLNFFIGGIELIAWGQCDTPNTDYHSHYLAVAKAKQPLACSKFVLAHNFI